LRVIREFFEEKEESLHRLLRAVSSEATADEVDFGKQVLGHDEFFASGAGFENIYGGVDVLFGDPAVEHELHVSGSFEFLENRFVGSGVRLDESCCENRE